MLTRKEEATSSVTPVPMSQRLPGCPRFLRIQKSQDCFIFSLPFLLLSFVSQFFFLLYFSSIFNLSFFEFLKNSSSYIYLLLLFFFNVGQYVFIPFFLVCVYVYPHVVFLYYCTILLVVFYWEYAEEKVCFTHSSI